MRITDRGYKIPDVFDSLELSVEMFQETLQKINNEQNYHDQIAHKVEKERRKKLITAALKYNPWEVK